MLRPGYTLPVFAAAAAKAALLHLRGEPVAARLEVDLDLLPEAATIPLEQVARLDEASALAIARSDPGDNLDLTRHTPLWAWVQLRARAAGAAALVLEGGEGLGKTATGEAAIYSYARRLLAANLEPLIPGDRTATVTLILPEGQQLAKRTSNEAFGILEGLSLLGTSGISRPFSAAEHLEELRADLQAIASQHSDLIFCIGSHGQQVAQQLGLPDAAIVLTGNWLGALLVEAGLRGVQSVLLLGYQGKLIKLAGGIFNTSSHLADAKLEIISAAVLKTGGPLAAAQAVLAAPTADVAYKTLVELGVAETVFQFLAAAISEKAQAYVQKYAAVSLAIGAVLFDRQGRIIARDLSRLGRATLWI